MHDFELETHEVELIEEWQAKQRLKNGEQFVTGGRWEYRFIPTSLGTIIYVLDGVTKDEFTVRGTESW